MSLHDDPNLRRELHRFYQHEGFADYQARLYRPGDWVHLTLKENILRILSETLSPGVVLLDVGCAEGLYLREVADWLALGVGVDISLPKLARGAQQATHLAHLALTGAELPHLPLSDKTFDGTICIETLEHVPDLVGSLAELYRVLRPGGLLVCSVPTEKDELLAEAKRRADWREKSGHIHSFSRTEFACHLRTVGFTVTHQFVVDVLGPQLRDRLVTRPPGSWLRRGVIAVAALAAHKSPGASQPVGPGGDPLVGNRLWPALDRILMRLPIIRAHGSLCIYTAVRPPV